jgi:hypothetical protein
MSKLSKFLGATIPVEVRGESLKLYPLTVKEMTIIDRLKEISDKGTAMTTDEKNEMNKLTRDLFKLSYKEENFTDDEIDRMDLALYIDLYSTIMENIAKTQNGKGFDRIRQLKEKVVSEEPSK